MKSISRLVLFLGLVFALALGFLLLKAEYRIQWVKNSRAIAGQALQADHPVAVYRAADTAEGRTVGALYLLDCTNPSRLAFSGFVTEKRQAGEQASLIDSGVVNGFSGLSPGRIYFASPVTPGDITSTPPALPGQFSIPIGIAVSPSALLTSSMLGAAVATTPDTPGKPTPDVSSDTSLQRDILKDVIDERVNDCLKGRKSKCQFLVAISEAQASLPAVRAALDKNCETRADTLDCFDSGRLPLPAEERAGLPRLKMVSESCMAGQAKDCLIAAGILEAQRNIGGQAQFYRQACSRGLSIACADLGEKLPAREVMAAEQRCGQRSAPDCIVAGGATHQKAPFEFACGIGDSLGCILYGYYFPRNPQELAQLEKSCKANHAPACLQLAGHRIGQSFDIAGGRQLLETWCKKKDQAACNFMEYHAGS